MRPCVGLRPLLGNRKQNTCKSRCRWARAHVTSIILPSSCPVNTLLGIDSPGFPASSLAQHSPYTVLYPKRERVRLVLQIKPVNSKSCSQASTFVTGLQTSLEHLLREGYSAQTHGAEPAKSAVCTVSPVATRASEKGLSLLLERIPRSRYVCLVLYHHWR